MHPALKPKYDAARLSRKIHTRQQIAVLAHHRLDPAVVEMKSNPAMMTTSTLSREVGGSAFAEVTENRDR
jgi:hypothetical protein